MADHDMMRLMMAVTLAIAILPTAAGADMRIVAKNGDPAPGTPVSFSQFEAITIPAAAPIISDSGDVSFQALNPPGIWSETAGKVEPVLTFFDVSFFFNNGLIASGNGHFAFTEAAERIFFVGPGGHQIVAEVGAEAPGEEGATFDVIPSVNPAQRMGEQGQFPFFTLDPDDDSRDAVWFFDSTAVQLVVRNGDAAPGFDPNAPSRCTRSSIPGDVDPRVTVLDVESFRSSVHQSKTGELALLAEVDCPGPNFEVLWSGPPNGLEIVAMDDDFIGPFEVVTLSDVTISSGGTVAFTGFGLRTGDLPVGDFVAVDDGSGPVIVAAEGQAISGAPGVSIDFVSDAHSITTNDRGQVLFMAQLAGASTSGDTALLLASKADGLVVVAREGSMAPDTSGALFDELVEPEIPSEPGIPNVARRPRYAINNAGTIAFRLPLVDASGDTTSANDAALWIRNSTGTETSIALRRGDTIEVAPGNELIVQDFILAFDGGGPPASGNKAGGLNDAGEIVLVASDGSNGAVVALPEPDASLLLTSVLGTLWLLGRRRANRTNQSGSELS